MADNSEQLEALINKGYIQIKNGRDATQTKNELVKEFRASGVEVLNKVADQLEGK